MSLRLKILTLVTLVEGLTACRRGNLETDSRTKGKQPASGIGIEAPDLFNTDRTAFQTRGVMVFKIADTYVNRVTEVSLDNLTTDKKIFENQVVAAGLEVTGDWSMLSGGTEIVVKVYPSSEEVKSKIKYGTNSIRLITRSAKETLHKNTDVRLKDFAFVGPTYSAVDRDIPVSRPLTGSVTGMVSNLSSNGKSYLITSPVHILTH